MQIRVENIFHSIITVLTSLIDLNFSDNAAVTQSLWMVQFIITVHLNIALQ